MLKGEVGVFTPREIQDIRREQIYASKLGAYYNKYDRINEEQIKGYVGAKHDLEKKEIEFLSNLREVKHDHIFYKTDLLTKKLGGLHLQDFENTLLMTPVDFT